MAIHVLIDYAIKEEKVARPLIGKIVSLLLSIAMVFGTSKIIKGDSFLSSLTNVGTETTTYSLVVLKSSGYKNVSSLKGKTIDYYANDKKKAMQVKENYRNRSVSMVMVKMIMRSLHQTYIVVIVMQSY